MPAAKPQASSDQVHRYLNAIENALAFTYDEVGDIYPIVRDSLLAAEQHVHAIRRVLHLPSHDDLPSHDEVEPST